MSNALSTAQIRKELFDSCLEHVEDFEDGPVSYCDLPKDALRRLWWTRSQKAVFVELVSRKGRMSLNKIASIVGKSVLECETYLDILQTAAQHELDLPLLTYADIPAAVEDNESETFVSDPTVAFTKVKSGPQTLVNYPLLMKRFNCVLTTETAEVLEVLITQRLRSIMALARFSWPKLERAEYMLDQFFEITAPWPAPADAGQEPDESGKDRHPEAADTADGEMIEPFVEDSENEWSDSEQMPLERQETELLEAIDSGDNILISQCSDELRAYMRLSGSEGVREQ